MNYLTPKEIWHSCGSVNIDTESSSTMTLAQLHSGYPSTQFDECIISDTPNVAFADEPEVVFIEYESEGSQGSRDHRRASIVTEEMLQYNLPDDNPDNFDRYGPDSDDDFAAIPEDEQFVVEDTQSMVVEEDSQGGTWGEMMLGTWGNLGNTLQRSINDITLFEIGKVSTVKNLFTSEPEPEREYEPEPELDIRKVHKSNGPTLLNLTSEMTHDPAWELPENHASTEHEFYKSQRKQSPKSDPQLADSKPDDAHSNLVPKDASHSHVVPRDSTTPSPLCVIAQDGPTPLCVIAKEGGERGVNCPNSGQLPNHGSFTNTADGRTPLITLAQKKGARSTTFPLSHQGSFTSQDRSPYRGSFTNNNGEFEFGGAGFDEAYGEEVEGPLHLSYDEIGELSHDELLQYNVPDDNPENFARYGPDSDDGQTFEEDFEEERSDGQPQERITNPDNFNRYGSDEEMMGVMEEEGFVVEEYLGGDGYGEEGYGEEEEETFEERVIKYYDANPDNFDRYGSDEEEMNPEKVEIAKESVTPEVRRVEEEVRRISAVINSCPVLAPQDRAPDRAPDRTPPELPPRAKPPPNRQHPNTRQNKVATLNSFTQNGDRKPFQHPHIKRQTIDVCEDHDHAKEMQHVSIQFENIRQPSKSIDIVREDSWCEESSTISRANSLQKMYEVEREPLREQVKMGSAVRLESSQSAARLESSQSAARLESASVPASGFDRSAPVSVVRLDGVKGLGQVRSQNVPGIGQVRVESVPGIGKVESVPGQGHSPPLIERIRRGSPSLPARAQLPKNDLPPNLTNGHPQPDLPPRRQIDNTFESPDLPARIQTAELSPIPQNNSLDRKRTQFPVTMRPDFNVALSQQPGAPWVPKRNPVEPELGRKNPDSPEATEKPTPSPTRRRACFTEPKGLDTRGTLNPDSLRSLRTNSKNCPKLFINRAGQQDSLKPLMDHAMRKGASVPNVPNVPTVPTVPNVPVKTPPEAQRLVKSSPKAPEIPVKSSPGPQEMPKKGSPKFVRPREPVPAVNTLPTIKSAHSKVYDLAQSEYEDVAQGPKTELKPTLSSAIYKAKNMITRPVPPPPTKPPPSLPVAPHWCKCTKCTDGEHTVCCTGVPEVNSLTIRITGQEASCITDTQLFKQVILTEAGLEYGDYLNKKYLQKSEKGADRNSMYRHLAYDAFINLVSSRYNEGCRNLVLPACVVQSIRKVYPKTNGGYRGFVKSKDK